jgi:release factor glutamine methyltransferase
MYLRIEKTIKGVRVKNALIATTHYLQDVTATPRLDAEVLMAHALGIERDRMLLSYLEAPSPDNFADFVVRRLAYEPVAYITGKRDFWSICLNVGPGALIPRPDSEILIEVALGHFGVEGPKTILDLGTGPGTLLLSALSEWPNTHGLGVDQSEDALTYANANAKQLGMAHQARFERGDWAKSIDEQFDLILCNPPYVEANADLDPQVSKFEPKDALFAGEEGLDDYRTLAPQIARLVAPGGLAVIEIGSSQAEAVMNIFAAFPMDAVIHKDLGGRDRCIAFTPR